MSLSTDNHNRTIIHIDLDCFYAQVEMIKNPSLRGVPLGIQQKNIIVTSNYVAREYGIKKCMSIVEAQKACPDLVIVKGEDLHDYRQTSYKVTNYLQKISPIVERLGLDENFIDVSELVNEELKKENKSYNVVGYSFGNDCMKCECGCHKRLKIGSNIAQEIRDGLKKELNLTSSAGVGHNKLLAKLVGSLHKPDQQTTLFPNAAPELLLTLSSLSKVPGIGNVTLEMLKRHGIQTVKDLQDASIEMLQAVFGSDKAKHLVELSYGIDPSPVKQSGKPLSIGLEDSFKSISVEAEIRDKFAELLNRLMILVSEDGRIPRTIKLTVRKFEKGSKTSHRETRQCNVGAALFVVNEVGGIQLTSDGERKIMSLIMHLFNKLVDVSKPYHVTLLGLSFTKFQQRLSGKSSIASYFVKDISVQSLTSLENKNLPNELPLRDSPNNKTDSPTDGSESEMEPSPKKSKVSSLVARRRFFTNSEDCASPSKLKVAELRLNSKDADTSQNEDTQECTNYLNRKQTTGLSSDNNQNIPCPPNADQKVFRELPVDVQQELWDEWKRERNREQQQALCNRQAKKPRPNTLFDYFIKN